MTIRRWKKLNHILRYAKDKAKLRKVVAAHPENYYNVSDETYQLMAALTNSEELIMHEDKCNNDEGGQNMCKALKDIRLEGFEDFIENME